MRLKAIIFLTGLLLLTCYGVSAAANNEITFWTIEVEKDRVEIQNQIADAFAEKTGIQVKVVPMEENLLMERVTAAFAAKTLPDVIFHPVDFTIGLAEAGVLDVASATETVQHLDQGTFGVGPLNQVKMEEGYAAVPVDGWGQLLLYRADLFKEKGLEPPDTWDKILKAAQTLHNPPLLWGFEAATDPGQVYTQQVFEHLALSNGVKLTNAEGRVDLNTPLMVETLEFYKSLAEFSPPGNIHWLHTRMDYLSGRAAMTIWSPFILDELSGLRQDQPVVPDHAKGETGFLARNTGFVSIIKGPHGRAQYGQTSYLGITVDADKKAAQAFVEYLLNDGYLKWLSMAPEGKLPVRKGVKGDPEKFIKGWMDLDFGVTSRAKISKFYGMETIKTIIAGVDGFDRWGFSEGKGGLVAKIYGSKIISGLLKQYLDGELGAKEAAKMIDEKVKAAE